MDITEYTERDEVLDQQVKVMTALIKVRDALLGLEGIPVAMNVITQNVTPLLNYCNHMIKEIEEEMTENAR